MIDLFQTAGRITLKGDKKVKARLESVDDKAKHTGTNLKRVGRTIGYGLLAAGAAVSSAAYYGLKEFMGFEKEMREVFTLLPQASEEMKNQMIEDIKEFNMEMGTMTKESVPALYQAISAGVPKENVFTFLEIAQKAAVGGVTDLTTAVDGMTSVVNAYGTEIIDATEASDLMFTAVRLGKTTFPELSQNMSDVVPIASSLGVNFADITAAIATMTAQGVPTVKATVQLRQAMNELSKTGTKAAKSFERVAGESFPEFIENGGNLQEAMSMLEEAAEANNTSVKNMFSNIRAGQAAISLTGTASERFIENLNDMNDSAGATDKAYQEMEKTLSRSVDKIKSNIQAIMTEFGEELAPFVKDFADSLIENMPRIREKIDGLSEATTDIIETLEPLFDVISIIWDTIKFAFDSAADIIVQITLAIGIVNDSFNLMNAQVGLAMAKFKLLVAEGVDWVIDKFSALEKLPGALGDKFKGLSESSDEAIQNIKKEIKELEGEANSNSNNIKNSFAALGFAFGDSGERVKGHINKLKDDFIDLAGQTETSLVDDYKKALNKRWSAYQDYIDKMGTDDTGDTDSEAEEPAATGDWIQSRVDYWSKINDKIIQESIEAKKEDLEATQKWIEDKISYWEEYQDARLQSMIDETQKEREQEEKAKENTLKLDQWVRGKIAEGAKAGTEWLAEQAEEKKQAVIDSLNARWGAYQEFLNKEKAAEAEREEYHQKVQNNMLKAYRESQIAMAKAVKESAEKQGTYWQKLDGITTTASDNMAGSIISFVDDVITGKKSFGQAMKEMALQLITSLETQVISAQLAAEGIAAAFAVWDWGAALARLAAVMPKIVATLVGFEALKAGIRSFEKGGVVPGPVGAPQLAVVHGGETITPPNKMNNSINITITGNYIDSDYSAQRMGNQIVKTLKRKGGMKQ